MEKLVLIDGNAILHRAFYALPETLTLKEGSPVNAVYGFVSILLRVINDLKPSHLVCTFDLPKPTFREAIFKEYRAQRPPTPEGLVKQIQTVKEVVRAFGIPIYELEGYEADDVIGTLSGKNKTLDVIIVTGDRDLLQLVDKNIQIYMPAKGLSQTKLYGSREVEEKYGVKPEQIVDYKALTGDPSDNYPGVKGIGPKTAAQLLRQFGTLENIYAQLEEKPVSLIDPRITELLKKCKEDALMAKNLAKIVTDIPIRLDLQQAKIGDLNNREVKNLFEKLNFKTLLKRVEQMNKTLNRKIILDTQLAIF